MDRLPEQTKKNLNWFLLSVEENRQLVAQDVSRQTAMGIAVDAALPNAIRTDNKDNKIIKQRLRGEIDEHTNAEQVTFGEFKNTAVEVRRDVGKAVKKRFNTGNTRETVRKDKR